MLDNRSIIEYFHYDIDLLKPVQFVCQLAYDIAKLQDTNFEIKALFSTTFTDEIGINFNSLEDSESDLDIIAWVAKEIAIHYHRKTIIRLDLSRTPILLLHQPSKLLYVLNKSNRIQSKERESKKLSTKTALINSIKQERIIQQVLNQLQNQEIKECIKRSISVEFEEIYEDCISITDAVPIEVPYTKFLHLDAALISTDIIDTSDIWINKDKFKSSFNIDVGPENDILAVKSNDNGSDIGIKFNSFFFPIIPTLNHLIDNISKAEFYWIQINEVFKIIDNNNNSYDSTLILDFKSKIKSLSFTRLLSNLKENLYLDSNLLTTQPAFRKYFTSTLKISQIKYLKKFNFFISDSESSTALGIYSFEKIGEDATHFNLLHWYDRSKGTHNKYRDNTGPSKVDKDVTSVSALLPELSFYFVTKYFEDFLDVLFKDLRFEFVSNFHLQQGSVDLGEFDFLVINNNKFFFIEAKTTLTKFYINDYRKKCQKIIKAFTSMGVSLEFVIIGAYSNESVEDLKIFIDTSHKGTKMYNIDRSDLAVRPYLFEVPIEGSTKKITCIAEPNYSKLKQVINKVCQR